LKPNWRGAAVPCIRNRKENDKWKTILGAVVLTPSIDMVANIKRAAVLLERAFDNPRSLEVALGFDPRQLGKKPSACSF